MPARKRNTQKSADARTRRDAIISMTVPYTTKSLIDMLSEFRGLTRSEYLRYLVLRDVEEYDTVNKIVAEAAAEGIKITTGRPAARKQTVSALAVEEENARTALVEKYAVFEDPKAWEQLFTENEDGEARFVSESYSCSREEFCDLPLKVMANLIAEKLNFVSNNDSK